MNFSYFSKNILEKNVYLHFPPNVKKVRKLFEGDGDLGLPLGDGGKGRLHCQNPVLG